MTLPLFPVPPGPASEVATVVTIVGMETAVFEIAVSNSYSLPAALGCMVVAGAVATGTALALLRHLNPFARDGGAKPPKTA